MGITSIALYLLSGRSSDCFEVGSSERTDQYPCFYLSLALSSFD